MLRGRLVFEAFALAFLLALVACADHGGVNPNPTGDATLSVTANLAGTAVVMVVVDVTAPDIPAKLVFNISVANGVASGSITVPAGSNRTITMRAFDAGGVETHSGSTIMSIQPGTNTMLSITLTPLTGNLPIQVNIGSFIVTVAPSSASLSLSGVSTVQLGATIKDSQGNPVSGVVTWATLDPGVAIVGSTGLVTATGSGTTTISAVYLGVSGASTITVAP